MSGAFGFTEGWSKTLNLTARALLSGHSDELVQIGWCLIPVENWRLMQHLHHTDLLVKMILFFGKNSIILEHWGITKL